MPLLQVFKPVLAATGNVARVSVKSAVVLPKPLLDNNPDDGGSETENETSEPEGIEPDGVERRLKWLLDNVVKCGAGGVDEGGVGAKALELEGHATENVVGLVCRGGLK